MTTSDEAGGRGALLLSSADFEVIFQVTKEAPNLRDAQLTVAGMTSTEVTQLLFVLRSMRSHMKGAVRVRIDLEGEDTPGPANGGQEDIESAEFEARGRIPATLASHWGTLMQEIIRVLGQRELYLRTGYKLDEIRSAISNALGAR